MTTSWTKLHPLANHNHLGIIPSMISPYSPAKARDQLDAGYQHGGGWMPMKGFTLDPTTKQLHYPGDPPTLPLWETKLRDETIIVYEHAWVAIIQADGSYEVARMD